MASNTEKLLKNISQSTNALYKNLEATEQEAWGLTLQTINKLKYNVNGALEFTPGNSRVIGDVKAQLDRLLKSPGYTKAVKDFGGTYLKIENLQNDYFKAIVKDFKPTAASKIVRVTAINEMVDNLVGGGVNQAVTQKAANILLQNMQAGANVRKVTEELRSFMLTDPKGAGALTKYSGQIATDSINQYAAAYNEQITEDLGFEWFQYVGSIRDTTRPFCNALVNQRYIHKSELSKAARGVLRVGTVSTAGMYAKTDGNNIKVLRGGYNCKHQFRGVATKNVPIEIREQVTGVNKKEEEFKKVEKQKTGYYSSEVIKDAKALKFKPVKNYNDIIDKDADINNDIFKQLRTETQIKPVINETSKYSPVKKEVSINLKRYDTPQKQRLIVAHEFGHAIHNQRRWLYIDLSDNKKRLVHYSHPIIDKTFKKWQKNLGFGMKYGAKKIEVLDKLNKNTGYDAWTEYLNLVAKSKDAKYNAEQWGNYSDTIGALTNNKFGGGHNNAYLKRAGGYGAKAEFVAHAFEIKYAESEALKHFYPELYDDMLKMINELIIKY